MKFPEQLSKTSNLLILGALLLSASLMLLATPVDPIRHWSGDPHLRLIRQGAFGLLALVFAWNVRRFSLHRPLQRFWPAFPAILLIVMAAVPVSIWLDRARFIYGYGWWTRSTGQAAFLLALIFSLGDILPRFARGERGGLPAFAGCLILSAALPYFFLKNAGMLFVGFAIMGLACSVVLPPKRLALALLGLFPSFSVTAYLWCLLNPGALQRLFALFPDSSRHFQVSQALVSINKGALLGHTASPVWIPEWHTDFLFARLCNAGGLVAGVGALFITGLLLVLAWRITSRQTDLKARALAAGCAAALTAPALLYVAVNLGLFPTTAFHFPFFSYSPRLLLFDGLLVGLLLSLDREPPVRTDTVPEAGAGGAPAALCPRALIHTGVALLLALFALRMGVLVVFPPWTRGSGHAPGVERQEQPERGRILDVKGRVLAQTGELLVAWDRVLKTGGDLRLTLDIGLQTVLQTVAENAVKETRCRRAQFLMVRADTGAIRAAVQVPALHGRPESMEDLDTVKWLACGEVFEPGGLLKPLIVAAALERGVITPESRINCEQGEWTVAGFPMRDPGRYDELTPAEILQKSSNIGMVKIGLLFREPSLYEAVVGWRLDRRCSAGLNDGESGILHSANHWSKLEATRLPIGLSYAVTLLQLLRAYSALFNDGRMVEPTLVNAIRPSPGVEWQPVTAARTHARHPPRHCRLAACRADQKNR